MTSARSILHASGALLLLSLGACAVTITDGGGTGGDDPGREDAGPEADAGPASDGGSPPPPPVQSWKLVAGGDNTCVISPDGRVACWGSNETGQLGLGDYTDRRTPAWIPALSTVTDLALGDFSMCARRTDGTVWCSGMNGYGELGATTDKCPQLGYQCSNVPVQASVTGASTIGAGIHYFCATKADGSLDCWGTGPIWDGSGYHLISMVGGYSNACGLFQTVPDADPALDVVCWGDDKIGQHGDGPTPSYDPTIIVKTGAAPFKPFKQIAAGMDFMCGVDLESHLYCWGQNVFGALGVGVSDNSDYPEACPGNGACATAPVLVASLPSVAYVAAHYEQACVVTTGGEVYCWGVASKTSPASAGACWGGPDCTPLPALVAGVSNAVMVAVGYGHACALTAANEVYCWGLDTHGQLGRGDGPSFDATPVKVVLPP